MRSSIHSGLHIMDFANTALHCPHEFALKKRMPAIRKFPSFLLFLSKQPVLKANSRSAQDIRASAFRISAYIATGCGTFISTVLFLSTNTCPARAERQNHQRSAGQPIFDILRPANLRIWPRLENSLKAAYTELRSTAANHRHRAHVLPGYPQASSSAR